MDVAVSERSSPGARCAYCYDALSGDVQACSKCGTRLHADCRAELGRCPTLGCGGTRAALAEDSPSRATAARALLRRQALELARSAALFAVSAIVLGFLGWQRSWFTGDAFLILLGLGVPTAAIFLATGVSLLRGPRLLRGLRRSLAVPASPRRLTIVTHQWTDSEGNKNEHHSGVLSPLRGGSADERQPIELERGALRAFQRGRLGLRVLVRQAARGLPLVIELPDGELVVAHESEGPPETSEPASRR